MNRLTIKALQIGLLLATAMLFINCSDQPGQLDNDDSANYKGDTFGNPTCAPNCPQNWTLLVYIAGDNNLEQIALNSVAEAARVGSTDQVNIVVQIDRSKEHSEKELLNLANWTGSKRLFVREGKLDDLSAKQPLGDLDSSNPATLTDFIKWGVKTYPANHYALFLLNHGGGWTGALTDDGSTKGKTGASYEEAANAMTVPEMGQALKNGLAAVNLKKFEILTFHACLMASMEVVTELAPYTNYIIASEEMITSDGKVWDYFGTAQFLKGHPQATTEELTEVIFNGYAEQCQRQAEGLTENCNPDATYSIIDTHSVNPATQKLYIQELADKVNQLANALYPLISNSDSALAVPLMKAREVTERYGFLQWAVNKEEVDLVDLLDNLANQPAAAPVMPLIDEIKSLITGDLIIKKNLRGTGAGSRTARANGLNIYFPIEMQFDYAKKFTDPTRDVFYQTEAKYRELKFAEEVQGTSAKGWIDLLKRNYSTLRLNKVPPLITQPKLVFNNENKTMSFNAQITGEVFDMTETEAFLGQIITNKDFGTFSWVDGTDEQMLAKKAIQLLWTMPVIPDANKAVSMKMNLQKIPIMTDGKTKAPVPIIFRKSSVEDWMNGRSEFLVGDISIQARIKDEYGEVETYTGTIEMSYHPQNGRIFISQAYTQDFNFLPTGTEFFLNQKYMVLESDSTLIKDKLEPSADWEHRFIYDLATLRIEAQPLSFAQQGPYAFGFLSHDLAENTGCNYTEHPLQ